jgi:hypothetical protein
MVEEQDRLSQKCVECDLSAQNVGETVKEYVAKAILREVEEWVANLEENQTTLEALHAERTQVSFYGYVIWVYWRCL